ncbi:amidohydrolase family protein [Micromonospora rubida]|uniref:amidohydrolase family protein n=1 Tax=Micromonospora rubida TaxID=2697657 RepID=UPI0013774471|nr:amidohydrolase family protein [Micromonospora rubida]NBE79820.1 amidohydrolase family protein [Micromonospora rubida]
MILDGHCHVASTDFVPRAFIEDVVDSMRRRLAAVGRAPAREALVDSYLAQHQDHDADRLVAEMDAAGVARAVLLVPDFGMVMAGRLDLAAMARRHHEIRQRHPGRFWVYLGADPRRGERGAREFADLADRYAVDGLKLYPPCGYSPSDPALYPYYEECRARRMPVFVHIGPTAHSLSFPFAHPLLIDRAARDFPDLVFVLGHGGVSHVDVTAYLALHRRNVYLDTGGFAGTPDGDWPARLNRLFRLGLNHKIIFGTDWPLNQLSGGMRRLLDRVVHGPEVFAGVPHGDRALLLGENLLRVLPPAPNRSGREAGAGAAS